MWRTWVVKLAIALLKNTHLSNDDRQLLTSALLDKLGALPLRARIVMDEAGQIFVDRKQMTLEVAQEMKRSAKSMLNNFARRFVREQVTFMAIQMGVHQNTSPEQGLYAKAALWFFQEEDELYRKLAQTEDVMEDDE